MTVTKAKKPSFVVALATFICIAGTISFGLLKLGLDAHVPIAVAAAIAALVGKFVVGITWEEMETAICNAISSSISALLILIAIGMLVGSWVQAGVVPGLIYYGFDVLSPGIFLFATLILCSIISLATGSSWGVGGTAGVALIGIAAGLGIPAPLTAGIIISGAYFGDKMSPLSDTTNLAPAVSGSNLFDHIRAMMWTTTPSYIIVAIITIVLGFSYSSGAGSFDPSRIDAFQKILAAEFSINPLYVAIPTIVVLGLAVLKCPALPSMMAGTAAASALAMFQGKTLAEALTAIHYGYESTVATKLSETAVEGLPAVMSELGITGVSPETAHEISSLVTELLNRGGLDSMMWSLSLIMIALVLGGVMESCHYLDVLLNPMLYKIRSVGGFVTLVVTSCFVSNLFLGDQYLAIVVPGRMFKTAVAKTELSPRMLSRTLEDCGTMTAVLVPWTGCGAFQSGALGVPTLTYAPYCFLNIINPFMAILLASLGIGNYWGKNGADRVEKRTALTFPREEEEAA
ncbi:Na+/H+ antiporter NhaC [Synergistes jonesii]|uniref:Na+/H+ antiporter NhaC n=1 Tax=Synergistes jonesii TaxID=2754 RepID=UPI00242DAD52|nr:Na+/H+ antiporter NhaC [Synergistes jonesii]